MAYANIFRYSNILETLDSKFLGTVKILGYSKSTTQGSNISGPVENALLVTDNGHVFTVSSSVTVPSQIMELSGVVGVCICNCYGDALAYTSEGNVIIWDINLDGKGIRTPTLVSGLKDVVDARCVAGHYLALSKSGKVYEWRSNRTSFTELPTQPTLIKINKIIVAIACGQWHSLALTQYGEVYSWGRKWSPPNSYHTLPLSKVNLHGETATKVGCGSYYSVVLTKRGKLFTWGYNSHGLGNRSGSTYSAAALQVGEDIGRFCNMATNSWNTSAAVTEHGAVYKWGQGDGCVSVKTLTMTQNIDLHQSLINVSNSNIVWKCNGIDSITTGGSIFNEQELQGYITNVDDGSVKLKKRLELMDEQQKTIEKLERELTDQQQKLETMEKDYAEQQRKLEQSESHNLKLQESSLRLEESYKEQQEKLEKFEKEYQNKGEIHDDFVEVLQEKKEEKPKRLTAKELFNI